MTDPDPDPSLRVGPRLVRPQDEPTTIHLRHDVEAGPDEVRTRIMPPPAPSDATSPEARGAAHGFGAGMGETDITLVTPRAGDTAPSIPASPTSPRSSTFGPFSTGGSPAGGRADAGPDAPALEVGRYRIVQRLGRGGMATVYRAHDPTIGRDVALKFLHAALCHVEECRTRFLREARAAGALSHPNIVVVHDVGEIDGRPYMAMELIDGTPLSDVLDERGALPIRDTVLVGLQLARALEYAHRHGVVHRDIKPGNIMLLRDGQTIKVTDFGIAHMDDGAHEQQTQIGAVIGTPQYMSPEQARGERLDGRSDLFAAGIVLYHLLTGHRPFQGANLVAVAQQIASAEPASIGTLRPDTPPALRRIVERCLRKQPAQRYASGQELAAALRQVLEEFDRVARERAKPRVVSLRLKWAATMALLVAVVMGITTAVITQRQQAALMQQAGGYGASLARFIAAQNAAAVLGDDWDAVDVAVQEMMKTGSFERIAVVDSAGVVRSSTLPAQVGQPYQAPVGVALPAQVGDSGASRFRTEAGRVLGFIAPINFRDKQIGRVALGIAEDPLTAVARLSITLMVVLVAVTVLAVAVAMYFVTDWFARPVRLIVESMGEIARGHFAHRIGEKRRDEFGELFVAFDDMAQALQLREDGVAAASSGPHDAGATSADHGADASPGDRGVG